MWQGCYFLLWIAHDIFFLLLIVLTSNTIRVGKQFSFYNDNCINWLLEMKKSLKPNWHGHYCKAVSKTAWQDQVLTLIENIHTIETHCEGFRCDDVSILTALLEKNHWTYSSVNLDVTSPLSLCVRNCLNVLWPNYDCVCAVTMDFTFKASYSLTCV